MRHTTFRFVLDPTPAQEQLLARYAGASRFAYNQCLKFVTDGLTARRMDPLVRVPWSGYDLINDFNAWKGVRMPAGCSSWPVTGPSPSR